MPDYSTPFTSGFSAGASAGHMRAMQMERMMELRAQEAQRAVQERYMSALADSISYKIKKANEEDAQDASDIKNTLDTIRVMQQQIAPLPEETPAQHAERVQQLNLNKLALKNPRAALKVGNALNAIAKPELSEQAMRSRETVAGIRATSSENVAKERSQTQLGVQELRNEGMMNREQFRAENPTSAGRLAAPLQIEKAIDDYTTQRDEAIEAGDIQKAEQMQGHIDGLRAIHPNFQFRQKLQGLQTDRSKVWSELILEKPSSARRKQLQADYDRITEEMNKLSDGSGAVVPKQGASAQGGATPNRLKFVPGQGFVPQ